MVLKGNTITYTGNALNFYTPVQGQWNGNKPVLSLSQYGEINLVGQIFTNFNGVHFKELGDFRNGIEFQDRFGTSNNFRGPVIFGENGGALGTRTGKQGEGESTALTWDGNGNVNVGGNLNIGKLAFSDGTVMTSAGVLNGFSTTTSGINTYLMTNKPMAIAGTLKLGTGSMYLNGKGVIPTQGTAGIDEIFTGAADQPLYLQYSNGGGKVIIGSPIPDNTALLNVGGKIKTTTLQITNGAATGKLLTSDADGNASWQNTGLWQNTNFQYTYQLCGYNPQNPNACTTVNADATAIYTNISDLGRQVRVGLGTSTPTALLDVNGTLNVSGKTTLSTLQLSKLSSGVTLGRGNILTSDENGSAEWSEALWNKNKTLASITLRWDQCRGSGNEPSQPLGSTCSAWYVVSNCGEFNTYEKSCYYPVNFLYSDIANYQIRVGIGTSSPTEKLEVVGKIKTNSIQMTDNSGNGKILASDANGNASWVPKPISSQWDDISEGISYNGNVLINNSNSLILKAGLLKNVASDIVFRHVDDSQIGRIYSGAAADGTINFSSKSNSGIISFTNEGSINLNARTITSDSDREIFFADNGQFRSFDNNHRILFRRTENKMELREFGDIVFSPGATAGAETAKITMKADGTLSVLNRVDSKEFRACMDPGSCPPDYVFDSDYKLMGLDTLKAYLTKNKHLPEVPSAKEMLSNGVNITEMNMTLLKKVEELTLYILKQESTMQQHQKDMKEMKKEILEIKSAKK